MIGTVLLCIALLFILLTVIGLFLPSKFSFSRSVFINADKKYIFNLLDNLHNWEKWSAWSKDNDPVIVCTHEGKEKGAGASMRWKGKKMGKGRMEIIQTTPYKSIAVFIFFGGGILKTENIFTLDEIKNEIQVTWEMKGRTRRSAPAKITGLIIFPKWMGGDMETGLKILKMLGEKK